LKENYPDSELVPTADLKIAEILIKKRNFIRAKQVLKTFIVDYEGTTYVKAASKYFGDILRKEGEFKEAVEYYKEALDNRRGDFNANIQYMIAELYEELEDFDNAIAEYMKVGYIYPDSTRIVVASQLACARLFEKQKKWQDAEKLYKKISLMDVEESTYARERLSWIRRNKR